MTAKAGEAQILTEYLVDTWLIILTIIDKPPNTAGEGSEAQILTEYLIKLADN